MLEASRQRRPRSNASAKETPRVRRPVRTARASQTDNENALPLLLELVDELKQRLQSLELDLERLRQENRQLLVATESHTRAAGHATAPATAKEPAAEATRNELLVLRTSVESQARHIDVLEARYKHLEEKAKAQAALYLQTTSKLHTLSDELFDAQEQIVKQRTTIQTHEGATAQVEDLTRELRLLRSENLALNEAVATLSSRPFDALSADLQHKALYIAKLEDENRELIQKAKEAQETAHVASQTSLKARNRNTKLMSQMDDLGRQLTRISVQCEQHQMDRDVAELQLRFYTSNSQDRELMEAVGKVLKQMKQSSKEKSTLQQSKEMTSRCSDIREPHAFERDRLARVSDLTRMLREDAQEQLASLKLQHAQDIHSLKRERDQWQTRATQYLTQIGEMQRQTGELLREHRLRRVRSAPLPTEVSSKTRSFVANVPEGSPSNVMEIVFTELTLSDWFPPRSSGLQRPMGYVMICDYYDFESQLSPLLTIPRADTIKGRRIRLAMDFGISFKLLQDAAFFSSQAARHVAIELHEVSVGGTTVMATGVLPLEPLFLSPEAQLDLHISLLNPFSETMIAILRVSQSLEHPVHATYKAMNRRLCDSTPSLSANQTQQLMSRHAWSSNGTAGLPSTSTIQIRLISVWFSQTYAAHVGLDNLRLSFRFMGFPEVSVILVSSTPQIHFSGHFAALDCCQMFEIDGPSPQLRSFLEHYVMHLQLQHSCGSDSDGDRAISQAALRFGDILGKDVKPLTLLPAIELFDRKKEGQVVGRIAVEIHLFGSILRLCPPAVEIDQLKPLITRLFGVQTQQDQELIRWSDLAAVLNMSPLDRSLRQLLFEQQLPLEGKSSSQELSSQLLCAFEKADQAGERNYCRSVEDLAAWLSSVVSLSRLDLDVFLSGLVRSVEMEMLRIDVQGSFSSTASLVSAMWTKLKHIVWSCDPNWVVIEYQVLHVSTMKRIPRSKSAVEIITWPECQQRLSH